MLNDRHKRSDEVVSELRATLADAGIVLPSLEVDVVSLAARDEEPPLVSLGRCTVETARALAAAVKGGRPCR